MAAISLDEVCKVYANGVKAVDNISLDIADGEFMVLVGPSGCGKSTLLRMIAGLEEVSEGGIDINGKDVTYLPSRERDIAMVFQSYALYPHMTVRQNLGFGLKLHKTPRKQITTRVDEVADVLGLAELMDRRPAQLSGGQRQRVAMGRAMVRDPQAYLMDEPLSNLDAKLRVSMRAQLVKLHDRLRATTIYVTHDQVEAMTLGDRVAVLRDGVLQQCDTPQEIYRNPCNLFTAAFIGSPQINLVHANVGTDSISFAGFDIPLVPDSALRRVSGRVVLGIRPNDLVLGRDAEPGMPWLSAKVDVVEELGSQTNIVFALDARRVVTDDVHAANDEGDDAQLIADDRATWCATVDGASSVKPGDTVELSIRTHRAHAFDPETGACLTIRD